MSDNDPKPIDTRHVPKALHEAIEHGWRPRGTKAPTATLPCVCGCGRALVVRKSDQTRQTGDQVRGYCCLQCRNEMARFLKRHTRRGRARYGPYEDGE